MPNQFSTPQNWTYEKKTQVAAICINKNISSKKALQMLPRLFVVDSQAAVVSTKNNNNNNNSGWKYE